MVDRRTQRVRSGRRTPGAGSRGLGDRSAAHRLGRDRSETGGTDAPANALDGNAATRLSTGAPMADGMWFQLDMQSARTFDQVTMDSGGSANDYARGYPIFVSSDGVNFGSPVATGTGTAALITVTFGAQTARSVSYRPAQRPSGGRSSNSTSTPVTGRFRSTAETTPSSVRARTRSSAPETYASRMSGCT